MKRGFDILFAASLLVVASPLFLLAAVGILVASPGPVFYRARRAGVGNRPFEMLKFRSMHVNQGGAVITSAGDARIFGFGKFLRKSKIDELPQFLNVLTGDMSVVGPRPEDPKIVDQHYTDWMMETLAVRPGITSPGAVFYYACAEDLVDSEDPEGSYVEKLLPPKLAVEMAYLQRANFVSDLFVIFHTAAAIVGEVIGRSVAPSDRDLQAATRWVHAQAFDAIR
ncbi:MAG: sugar transferase [Pseudomonadota bacterium]